MLQHSLLRYTFQSLNNASSFLLLKRRPSRFLFQSRIDENVTGCQVCRKQWLFKDSQSFLSRKKTNITVAPCMQERWKYRPFIPVEWRSEVVFLNTPSRYYFYMAEMPLETWIRTLVLRKHLAMHGRRAFLVAQILFLHLLFSFWTDIREWGFSLVVIHIISTWFFRMYELTLLMPLRYGLSG
jgi:hypothetical protein